MQTFLGMILGALLLGFGVYIHELDADVHRRQRSGVTGHSHYRELGRRGKQLAFS